MMLTTKGKLRFYLNRAINTTATMHSNLLAKVGKATCVYDRVYSDVCVCVRVYFSRQVYAHYFCFAREFVDSFFRLFGRHTTNGPEPW